MGEPANGARDREKHGEVVHREAHSLVDQARVEIYVRVQLAGRGQGQNNARRVTSSMGDG